LGVDLPVQPNGLLQSTVSLFEFPIDVMTACACQNRAIEECLYFGLSSMCRFSDHDGARVLLRGFLDFICTRVSWLGGIFSWLREEIRSTPASSAWDRTELQDGQIECIANKRNQRYAGTLVKLDGVELDKL